MQLQQTIELIIGNDGKVENEAKGFKGTGCKTALAEFENLLGNVETQQPTAELYEEPEKVSLTAGHE